MTELDANQNTDRELWRERDGDFYADSIFVTEKGSIGINCGGHVIVKTVRNWFALAAAAEVGSKDPYADWMEARKHEVELAKLATIERCIEAIKAIPYALPTREQYIAAIEILKEES